MEKVVNACSVVSEFTVGKNIKSNGSFNMQLGQNAIQ